VILLGAGILPDFINKRVHFRAVSSTCLNSTRNFSCKGVSRVALVKQRLSRDRCPVIAAQDWTDGRQGKQLGFFYYEQTTAKKQANREKSLVEMEAVDPWDNLITLIEPHYPEAGKKGGCPPCQLATMRRIHLL